MERTKLLTIAVIGLLLLNLITIGLLLFRPIPLVGHLPGNNPARVIIKRLRLDTTQKRTYRRLVAEHQRQTRALTQESARLYQSYYELLADDKPDSVRANTLSEQIGRNQRAMAQLNLAHFTQIKSLCRPDQQPDFAKLVTELSQLFNRPQPPNRPGPDQPDGEETENSPERP